MIIVKELQKEYDNTVVLDIPHLNIIKGQNVGLVGNNGAGKSTLLQLVLDLLEPSKGSIAINTTNVSLSEDWKNHTGSFLNERFLIPYLTPIEYIEFIGKLHGMNKKDIEEVLLEFSDFFNFSDKKKTLIRDLSAGNRNKIGIIGAFIGNPSLILFDEPFSFLDPSSQSWLKRKLNTLSLKGVTMLISSHDLQHITEISNRIVLIEKGIIIQDMETNLDTLKVLEGYFNVY